MNETTLNDLKQKIHNLVHDFELEHGMDGLVNVRVETTRIIVETEARALGGHVNTSAPYGDFNEGKELFIPSPNSTIIPNESGIIETGRVNTADAQGPESVYPIDAPLPLLDEHTADTDLMIVPPGALEGTGPTGGYIYDDAPGMVFANPDEHMAWQRAQVKQRKETRYPNSTISKRVDPDTSTL